jgi:multimeric flavodoxin WrbA
MKTLLIVWHSQFGCTAQMAEAAREGASAVPDVAVAHLRATDAQVQDLLDCDALIVATSENFGSLSGMTKDFLERVFYPCESRVEGKPYTSLVCAGTDGTGAIRDLDRIAKGLRLRRVHPGILHKSGLTAQAHSVPAPVLASCRELGGTIAAGLAVGIY